MLPERVGNTKRGRVEIDPVSPPDPKRRKSGRTRATRVTLDDDLGLEAASDVEILHIEDALNRLAAMHERMARIVELRIFGGLTIVEIAHVVGLARQTVHDDWRVAKMWINRELTEGTPS